MKIQNFNRAHFGKKRQFSCGVIQFDNQGFAEVTDAVAAELTKSYPFITREGETPEGHNVVASKKEISGNVSELKQVIADLYDTIARRDIEIRSLKQSVGYAEQDTKSFKDLVDKLQAELQILKKAKMVMDKDEQVKTENVQKTLENELAEKTKVELVTMCEEMGFEKADYTNKNKPELIKLLMSI